MNSLKTLQLLWQHLMVFEINDYVVQTIMQFLPFRSQIMASETYYTTFCYIGLVYK